jgi:PKD repeat protein
VRSDSILDAASQAVAIVFVILILISVPPPNHMVGDHAEDLNSTNPSTSSPASFPNQSAIPSSPSYARGSEKLGHPRNGLLPISATSLQLPSSIPAANYDEQLGTTFTQNFASLAYNVTAVAQSDTYGYGPAYLLNGLGFTGYWYQVGLSYDWPLIGGGYSPGFGMNYEVFDPQGASIFPSSGGGLSSIQVNPGDTVLLNLYITRGNVAMLAKDWNTSSTAVQTYSAARANSFVGMTSSFADRNGFFTGLMTERYHVHPYYSNDEESTFSNHTHALTSAWMWIDEFGIAPFQPLFSDASRSPIILSSNPDQLQPFGSHGAYEAVDSYEFVTGFQPTPVQVSRPIPQPVSSDVGQLVSFTCGATGGIPPFTYSWTFGDGSGATGQNVSHTFNSPGTMNIQCTVIDNLQTSSQNATSIMVLSDPSISLQTANPTSVDIGQTVTFTAQATGGSGGYAYLWTGLPTGCSSSNIPTIACQPSATGTFPVTANITDSNGFSITSSTLSVSVSPDLSLTSFTASPDKLDIGQTITFAASASGGSGGLSFAYYGLPTGCETANSTNLSCTPTSTGTYHVILTVTDSNGLTVSNSRITVAVSPDPTAAVVASPSPSDLGQTLTLAVTVHGGTGPFSYSYPMLPPSCTSSNSPTLSCTPSTVGNYTIEAIVADEAGQTSTTYINMSVNPIIRISTLNTSLTSLDTGQEFTLTLSTTGGTAPLSYSYSGLPPSCSSINSPVLHCTPSTSGLYLIQATVTDKAGKTATSSLNVTVQPAKVTGLTANHEYLLFGGLISAFIFAIIVSAVLLRGGKRPSKPATSQDGVQFFDKRRRVV